MKHEPTIAGPYGNASGRVRPKNDPKRRAKNLTRIGLVTHDQDWREGRRLRPLCRLPDGGSGDPKNLFADVLRFIAVLRPPTRYVEGVMRSGVTRSLKPTGEVRLDCEKFCALNVRLASASLGAVR
jgi:hypothetical protein